MSRQTKQIAKSFFDQASEIRVTACTVTSVSPLTINVGGQLMKANAQNGVTYNTTMPALAIFMKRGGQPWIIQFNPS